MGMIRIYQGKSKPKPKKPGWEQEKQQHDEWLAKVNSMTLGVTKPKKWTKEKIDPVVKKPVVNKTRLTKAGKSVMTPGDTSTKPVLRPEILYRDDPEMLARELKARERQFNVAPAYNKGGDQYVSEEELVKLLSGNKRRS